MRLAKRKKTVSVEDAANAIVAEAEKHEKKEGGEFCVDTRASLVVWIMLQLGLGLEELGFVAEQLSRALALNKEMLEKESKADVWPSTIGEIE